MTEKRVFTDEELREMEKRTVDVVQEVIDTDDKEKSKRMARRMYREFQAMHDLYRDWTTALLSFIGRRYGDEVLFQAVEESMGSWYRDAIDLYPRDDFRRMVEMLAMGLRGHLQKLRIEEDDEKVTIMMEPCGSGGRMISSGYYDTPRNYLTLEKAQPMTFDREDFPVYCTHCFFQDALPIIWGCRRCS